MGFVKRCKTWDDCYNVRVWYTTGRISFSFESMKETTRDVDVKKGMEIWAQQSIWRFMYSTAFVEYQDSIVKSCSLSDFLYSIKSIKDFERQT